jgi:MFS family permease
MKKFGKLVALMAMLVVGYFVVGMVTMYLWGWFVSPTFNITTLSLVQAIGISVTAGYLSGRFGVKEEKEKEHSFYKTTVRFAKGYVFSVLVLTLGYLIQLFL